MAETVQYMIPTTKAQPKMEPRFFKGIWLGRDTMTGESIVGIPGKVIKARTIRRQIMPDKYDKQLLDTINVYPWNLPTAPMAIPTQLLLPADNTTNRQAIGTQADTTDGRYKHTDSTRDTTGTTSTSNASSANGYDNGNITIGNFTNNNGKTTTAITTSKQATT